MQESLDIKNNLKFLENSEWIEWEKKVMAWLALPYADRQKHLSTLQFEIIIEQLKTSNQNLFKICEPIFDNYTYLMATQTSQADFTDNYNDSVKNFNFLLARIKDKNVHWLFLQELLLDQAHWLTALLLISKTQPAPAAWEEAGNVANTFYYSVIPLLWNELSLGTKVSFCLKAANIFHEKGYYREALPYVSQAFIVAWPDNLLIKLINNKMLELENPIIQKLREGYFHTLKTLLSRQLSDVNVLEEWHKYNDLLTAMAEKGDYKNLALLYDSFEPLLTKNLEFLDKLSSVKDDTDSIKKLYAELIENYIARFNKHGRYILAEIWCEKIEAWFNDSSGCINKIDYLRDECSNRRLEFQKKKRLPLPNVAFVNEQTHFHETLARYREELQRGIDQNEPPLELQNTFSRNFKQLLSQIATHIVELLGEPPCPFSLLGLGSMSRNDMSLHSDADVVLLIASSAYRQHPYFTAWLQLWLFYLQSLGDLRPFWISLGLQDADDFKDLSNLANEPYVQDPEALVQWVVTTLPASSTRPVRALYYPTELYTTEKEANLFSLFIIKLAERLEFHATFSNKLHEKLAKEAFKEHETEYHQAIHSIEIFQRPFTTLSPLLNSLKQALIKPFVNICLDIGLYKGMVVENASQLIAHLPTLFDVFEQQHIFPRYFVNWLHEYWKKLQQIRHRLHQKPFSSKHGEKIYSELREINTNILQPLWSTWNIWLTHRNDQPFDPIDAMIKQQCPQAMATDDDLSEELALFLSVWLKSRIDQAATFESYQEIYALLSDKGQAFLLAEGKKLGVRHSILELLAAIPRSNGYRQNERWQLEQLIEQIRQLLLPINIYQKEKMLPQMPVALETSAPSCDPLLHCPLCDLHSKQQFTTSDYVHMTASLQLPGEITPRELVPIVVQHLLDPKTGRLREIPLHSISHTGVSHRHRVVAITLKQGMQTYAVHFKEKPDHPLMDYAIYSLRQRLFGHGSPANVVAKLTVISRHPQYHYCYSYPVLISATVGGPEDNLKTYLDKEHTLHLSLSHFYESVLFDAVARPGDGSARNYQIKKLDNNQQTLVCVDNDQYFVNPVVNTLFSKKLQIRSILFCFSEITQLDKAILSKTLQAFVKLDIKELLKHWLQELIQYENTCLQLFKLQEREQHFQKDAEQNLVTLHLLFSEGMIFSLGTDLCNLQAQARTALANNQFPSVIQFVERLHDLVAYKYQQELAKTMATPSMRFKTITDAAQISKTSSQSLQASLGKIPTMNEIENERKYSPLKALQELALLEGLFIDKHIHVKMQYQEIYLILDFEKNPMTLEKQKALLNLQLQRRFTHIAIHYSDVLDNTLLRALITQTGNSLTYLRLKHCPLITAESLDIIIRGCPQLKKLSLIENKNLTSVHIVPFYPSFLTRNLIFPQLTHLNLSHHANLIEVKIDAPNLEVLKIKNCTELKKESIKLNTPRLKTFSKNVKVEDRLIELPRPYRLSIGEGYSWSELKQMAMDHSMILLSECYRMYDSDLYQLAKIIASVPFTIFYNIQEWDYHYFDADSIKVLAEAIGKNKSLMIFNLYSYTKSASLSSVEKICNQLNQNLQHFMNENAHTCEECRYFQSADVKYYIVEGAHDYYTEFKGEFLHRFVMHVHKHRKSCVVTPLNPQALLATYKNQHHLTQLNLSVQSIDDLLAQSVVEIINNNPLLEELNLSGNELTMESGNIIIEALKNNQQICELRLDGNHFDKSILDLAKVYVSRNLLISKAALKIDLYKTQITDEGAQALVDGLSYKPSPLKLSLYHCKISAFGWQIIFEAVKHHGTLINLDLSSNKLDDQGVVTIAEVLKRNQKLLKLKLYDNRISHIGIQALAETLETHEALTNLDLDWNQVGDQGAMIIAKMLKRNRKLLELCLDSNQISHIGVQALAEALKNQQSLVKLALNGNNISDQGAVAIAEMLKQNRKLIELDLGYGKIGDKGVQVIAKALEINPIIRRLILAHNVFDSSGSTTAALAQMLTINQSLRELSLDGCKINDADVAKLFSALKINRVLSSLNLNNNLIHQSKEIINTLTHNHILTELYIASGYSSLWIDIEKNYTLLGFDSYDRPISKKNVQYKILQRNRKLRDQLHQAAESGDLETLQRLVVQGVSLLSTSKNENTPLHVAVQSKQLHIVKWLVNKMKKEGVPLNVPNELNQTVWDLAQQSAHDGIIQYLAQTMKLSSSTDTQKTTASHGSKSSNILPMTSTYAQFLSGKLEQKLQPQDEEITKFDNETQLDQATTLASQRTIKTIKVGNTSNPLEKPLTCIQKDEHSIVEQPIFGAHDSGITYEITTKIFTFLDKNTLCTIAPRVSKQWGSVYKTMNKNEDALKKFQAERLRELGIIEKEPKLIITDEDKWEDELIYDIESDKEKDSAPIFSFEL